MLTENPLTEVADPTTEAATQQEQGPGERVIRLQRRRRLVREELLAVAVLLLFLAATVAVLATQWLASGTPAHPAAVPPVVLTLEPHGGAT